MSQVKSGYASEDITRSRFGYPTEENESDVTVGTTAIQLVPNNPNRIQLQVYNNGQGQIYMSRNRNVALNTGAPIGANGGSAILLIAEDGQAVGYERWAISGAAGNSVHIIETLVKL